MSLIENETCEGECKNHKDTEIEKWSDHKYVRVYPTSNANVPIGVIIDAIQHGHYSVETIQKLKSKSLVMSRSELQGLVNETVSDSIRFQLGLILHDA